MTVKRLLVADLFAGAGGLAAGFHMAGFKTVFFNELDATAANTFQANFQQAVPFVCPIEDLTAQKILATTKLKPGQLDVMVGGPPCQGFSINAPVRSDKDPRNRLFQHYVRLVLDGIRPKIIVMENVPGLISFDQGKTLSEVLRAFNRAGYRVIFKILNAAHYGVPEERWRLVFIGTRLPDIELNFPYPTHYSLQRANFTGGREHTFIAAIGRTSQLELFHKMDLRPPTTIQEALDDLPPIPSGGGKEPLPYVMPPQNEYQKLLRTGSRNVWNHVCSGLAPINKERFRHVRPGGSWRDIPFKLLPDGLKRARRSDHTKRYGRLDPKGVSGTILTKCDPHWGTFVHYNQDRIISVREAARLQSFPDWFHFRGSRAEMYRQVGNAVPPLLARALALHILSMFKKRQKVQIPSLKKTAIGKQHASC